MYSRKPSGQRCDNVIITCGFKWTTTGKAYRCQTCELSPSMALCSDCFKGGNHEGHDFHRFSISAGGFCDCGDKSFLKETGFCQRHGQQHQINKPRASPEIYVYQLGDNIESVKTNDDATTCGVTWPANYKAYRCRTCALSPTMSLCSDCFLKGNHEGHDFNVFRSPVGGFCDCGDKSFLKESGFCPIHSPGNQISNPGASPVANAQHLKDNTQKSENTTTCGMKWTVNGKAYRCLTCALSPTMSLCSVCFNGGNHYGHNFYSYLSSAGGFCDCGDKSFMRESGFCSRHGPQNQINQPEASSVADVQESRNNTESASERLSRDLKSVMLNGDHSDVIVKVKGEEFRLHKVILSARNPYFDAMFKTDMKEMSTGIVTIEDCEPDVFRSFMHFLYTGKVEEFSASNVCGLYEVADKYQENDLKKECLHFMLNALSVESFFDFIVLALRYDEMELLRRATDLFTTKGKEIARNVKWQDFMKQYPVQANELFIKTLDHYIK